MLNDELDSRWGGGVIFCTIVAAVAEVFTAALLSILQALYRREIFVILSQVHL